MNEAAEAARIRYIDEYGLFVQAAAEMEDILNAALARANISATVQARAKDVPSFVKKIGSKYSSHADPWQQVTDKVGARIIVGTQPELKRTERAVVDGSALEILSFEDKRVGVEPNQLIYPGTHLNVIVPDLILPDGEKIQCEIQIRSKAEDLWSVPSHKLLYKGVLSAPPETQRRIWRLQAIVELFDEEVARAMDEVESLEGYSSALLLQELESAYLQVVAKPGDDDLSMEAMRILAPLVPQDRLAAYRITLSSFVQANYQKLEVVYRDYGYSSSWSEDFGYWMFTQPESIMVFERITHDPASLRSAVQYTELESAVRPLFDAWGQPFDLD